MPSQSQIDATTAALAAHRKRSAKHGYWREIRQCEFCAVDFWARESKKARYCSHECAANGRARSLAETFRRKNRRPRLGDYPEPALLEVFNRLKPVAPGHFFGWRRV